MAIEKKCSTTGCESRAHARGYCRKHYRQLYRNGEIRPEREDWHKAMGVKCAVAGCEGRLSAKGYCYKHYRQIWDYGKIRTDAEERRVTEREAANKVNKLAPTNDSDRVRALARELRRAEIMYKNVVGVEGRLKWRREIDEVKKEMVRLGVDPAELVREQQGEENALAV